MRIPLILRQLAAAALVAALVAAPVGAQAGLMPDSMLRPIAASDLAVTGVSGTPTAVAIPTVLLHLSVRGSMRVSIAGTRSSTRVNAYYDVAGLAKELIAEVALLTQMELAARLRKAGIAVVADDSVSASQQLARHPRLAVDTAVGAPSVSEGSPPTTFAIVAPSDTQVLSVADSAHRARLVDLAKELNATVIIPELWFQSPQLERGVELVHGTVRTGLTVGGGMDFIRATLTLVTPSGAVGTIALRKPIPMIAEYVGDIDRLGSTVTSIGTVGLLGRRLGGLGRNRTSDNDYALTIIPNAYSRGLLVGTVSFFQAAASIIAAR